MLFNSFEFLLLFLPLVLAGFYGLRVFGSQRLVLIWLIVCSLVFHAYWKASYTWLFVVSVMSNYVLGQACSPRTGLSQEIRKGVLFAGIAGNLGLLGYFKYANFFGDAVGALTGVPLHFGEIVLPLAISFYTFQQIAFLVDSYRGRAPFYSFLQYFGYLAFFPHLIAGPIVRHSDLVPQLSSPGIVRVRAENLITGTAIIFIGLFKKVGLADGAAAYVDPIFHAAASGSVGFFEAWLGAVLFSFVVYFDFSGYSDIAIGLARLFNVRFPENFASPYKAVNISDFWRRWHITLSTFLRDYLYIPLGGSRQGLQRQYYALMATMLLGGLWHGAGWNFVIWGGLHGAYLVVYHAWRRARGAAGWLRFGRAGEIAGRTATYISVVLAWVFFRSSTFDQAVNMLGAMAGFNGASRSVDLPARLPGLDPFAAGVLLCMGLLAVVNALPNTQQFMRLYRPVLGSARERPGGLSRRLVWSANLSSVCFVVALGLYAMGQMETVQPFMYFRF